MPPMPVTTTSDTKTGARHSPAVAKPSQAELVSKSQMTSTIVAAVHGQIRRQAGKRLMSNPRVFSSDTEPARLPRVAFSSSKPMKMRMYGAALDSPVRPTCGVM